MAFNSIRLPEAPRLGNSYVLQNEIPALQLVATDEGQARWGPLIRLPRGAELLEFGDGFDERTLTVRFGTSFYIVFQQDLGASQRTSRPHRRAEAAVS